MQDNENYSKEVWKDVCGYEGVYQVSSLGRCRSFKHKVKIMKDRKDTSGYINAAFTANGLTKTFLLHRIIATLFIPNPENKPQVNHINGVKTDNRIENLEWCTNSENQRHLIDVLGYNPVHLVGRLNARARKIKCTTTGEVFDTIALACEKYGLISSSVSMVASGKLKQTKGYKFERF